MPTYQPNIPTGTVNLDVDYLNLQGNFQQANIVYGTDHYPFDNVTPNQGFHNVVTNPAVVNNPPDSLPPSTAAGIAKLYAYEPYSTIGLLQYSRGPSNAIPTPITNLNGGPISIAHNTSVNIIDFAGMTRVMCYLSAFNDIPAGKVTSNNVIIAFSQGNFNITAPPFGVFGAASSGTVLQLSNTTGLILNNVYWTIQFIRIE